MAETIDKPAMTPYERAFERIKAIPPDMLSYGLLAVLAAIALLTVTNYGVTWDEDVHAYYGDLVLRYYTSGFEDERALSWWNLYYYGAMFDTLAAALAAISPLGLYETRHILNAAVGLTGLFGAWKLARTLGGSRVAFWAALFLALVPHYYGHMFNNPKDVPFAVGMIWGVYYIVRLIPHLPAPPWSLIVKFGIVLGLVSGVRVGGVLLLCYLGLVAMAVAFMDAWPSRSFGVLVQGGFKSLWRTLMPAAAIAYPIMLLGWPWAQQAPLTNPFKALAEFSHHTYPWKTLFDGQLYWTYDLPWTYLPTHIVLKLPELVLLMAALGAVIGLWRVVEASRGRRSIARSRGLGISLIAFSVVFPVAYAIAIGATLFDGMRHFLFVMPPIAVLAAIVFDRLLSMLRQFRWRYAAYGLLATYFAYHTSLMVRLHPDEYVYFNNFVGGVAGAKGRYQLDYWANSYAEAVNDLEERLRETYGDEFEGRKFSLFVCGPRVPATYYFPDNFQSTIRLQEADFVLLMSGFVPTESTDPCSRTIAGREFIRVERMDTTLSVVLDRRMVKVREQTLANAARLR